MGDASTDAFEDDRIAPDASSGEGSPTSDDVTTFGSCPSDVLCSKFVLISLVFNLITTFGMSALVFSILFIFLGDPTYEWHSVNVIGVIVFGSVYLEPMLLMALAPVTMIDANIKGWFPILRVESIPPWQRNVFPFLLDRTFMRNGSGRYLIMGLIQSVIMIPLGVLMAYIILGDRAHNAEDIVLFDASFNTVLAIPSTFMGLYAFSIEHNYQRVRNVMEAPSEEEWSGIKTLSYRIWGGIRLIC